MEALQAIINALNSLLVTTSRDGNLEIVRRCLEMGADINTKNVQGFTALILSSVMGHVEIVSELLKSADILDVNAKDMNGSTALIGACYNGHLKVVRELLKSDKVNVNEPTFHGETALSLACHKSRWDVVLELLKHGSVDINAKNISGDTPLILTVDKGNASVVTELLKHDELDINMKNVDGDSAIIIGSWNGHVRVVCELLKHKNIDQNARNGNGDTPLTLAAHNGHLEVVCELLKHPLVDVNARNNIGDTALLVAIRNGYFKIVCALLKHNKVDVNARNNYGDSALVMSITKGNLNAVQELLKHDELDMLTKRKNADRALDIARKVGNVDVVKLIGDDINRRLQEAMRKAQPQQYQVDNGKTPPSKHGKMPISNRDPSLSEITSTKNGSVADQPRELLRHVMTTPSSDPVELPYEYVQQCITTRHLGSGAFGDVYMGEDSMLPKPFAVKKISLAHSDEETILEIQRSFRRELATLKRFRHPNIIALYGYNLRVNHTQQFLLYEYAAFGALDGFLRDDGNRARLPADVRLSIMYELTRAVHFLHTGGCKGFIVCHRDIKSANICLTEDFTARIIDCGLAKFVCDDEKALPGSVTPSVRNSSGGNAFGTPGYICPMYARGGCSFMAACDVYSIGVVMVELILGCLNGGQSTRNGTQFSNVFERYIKDKFDEPVKDGWKQLIQDADPSILWNSDSLEVVCETAIACMASSPYKRLSTHDLLPRLSTAITLNTKANAKSNSGTKTANVPACVESSVRSGVCCACAICNQTLSCIKCSKGHALCQYCIENSVLRDIVGGRRARCAIKMCSSIPFEFEELCGHVSVEVYNQYVVERTTRSVFDSCLRRIEAKVESLKVTVDGMKVGVDKTQQLMQSQQRMLQKLGKGLDRSLAVLALLAANLFRECPNLIWLTPISVNATNPMQWIKKTGMHKYSVVFVCAYSLEPGHVPFEIEVPKGWIAKIAPVLQLSLMALKGAASSFGFPFPLPNLTFLQQSELMTHFLDTVAEESVLGTLTSCQTLVENGILDNDYGELQTLMGPAFQMIAEKAKGVQNWKPPQMVPVCDQNGTPIWIKGVHQGAFR